MERQVWITQLFLTLHSYVLIPVFQENGKTRQERKCHGTCLAQGQTQAHACCTKDLLLHCCFTASVWFREQDTDIWLSITNSCQIPVFCMKMSLFALPGWMQLSFYSKFLSLDCNYPIFFFLLLHFSPKTFRPGLVLTLYEDSAKLEKFWHKTDIENVLIFITTQASVNFSQNCSPDTNGSLRRYSENGL